jgi:HAD superfamily hydrolase (TIGR01509 family)
VLLNSWAMRAILFDFGGTLDVPRHWLDRFTTHYAGAGLPITRSELDPAFDAATRTAYGSAALLSNYSLADLVHFLLGLQLAFLKDTDWAKSSGCDAALADRHEISRLTNRISRAFVEESLAGLAQSRAVVYGLARHFVIGVVSNFYGNLQRILLDANFGSMVAAVTDSSRVGIFKPNPGIYRAALATMRVRPDETFMVGDSLNKDCAPARQLGMRTVWLRHREANPNSASEGLVDFTIGSLSELQELVCRSA